MIEAGVPTRAVATLMVAAAAWLSLVGYAAAAPGQIGYDGCLASKAAQGCVDLPGAPLDGALGVAVSPDSNSVYVASVDSDSVAHFSRSGAQGRLAYDGCLANDAAQGCVDLPFAPLDGAEGVAVSPDGRSVYVASVFSNSINHFFRSAQGRIALDGCLANDATQGCGDLTGVPLGAARGVAVSPDGRSVYVASVFSRSIAHFLRSGPQGQIIYDGCFASFAGPGCVDLPGEPLDAASGVAVSPDGRSVYVASEFSDSISHFLRSGPQGQIVYAGCFANDSARGCVDLPGAPLDGAVGVAVSRDGGSVYVASDGSDSIAHFRRSSPEGQIVYDGCMASTAARGCVDLPGAPLDGAFGVAVSADGRSVYVASQSSDAVAHFFRDRAAGRLAYDGCLANTAALGCGDLPLAPLDGPVGVAVSPDGRSVYVASIFGDSIAHFFRALGDAPPSGTVTTPGRRRAASAPVLRRLRISPSAFRAARTAPSALPARRRRAALVSFTLDRAASVRFTVERGVSGRRVGRRCVKRKRSNRSRRHCTRYSLLSGGFSRHGVAGANRLRFTGRLNARRLRPGGYRFVARPSADGRLGVAKRAGFRIKR